MPPDVPAPIVVTRRGLRVHAGGDEFDRLAESFARRHHVRLPGFFGADMREVFRQLPDTAFVARVEDGLEVEHTLAADGPLALAYLALNDPALFRAVERLTGCTPLRCFSGRAYRRLAAPAGHHYYPWHDDMTEDRRVGLTVNLSETPFEGGALQMRYADTQEVFADVVNHGYGDAVLFRISEALEHHVTPVTSAAPRLVMVGWFRSAPDFWAGVLS
ncbi:MAG: 2OG-Fe(II) oxygenase [Acidobacteriota bacterium]